MLPPECCPQGSDPLRFAPEDGCSRLQDGAQGRAKTKRSDEQAGRCDNPGVSRDMVLRSSRGGDGETANAPER